MTSQPSLSALLGVIFLTGCSGEDPGSTAAGQAGSSALPNNPPLMMAGAPGTGGDTGGETARGGADVGGGGAAPGGAAGDSSVEVDPYALVDAECWDGQVYLDEPIPKMRAAVDDLFPSFSVETRTDWSIEVLERRYPTGALLLAETTIDDPDGEGNCLGVSYQPDDTTPESIINGFRTSVHECGHMMDLQFGKWVIRPDLIYECDNGIWEQSPYRSVILNDEYDALGPTDGTLDFQKRTYLDPEGIGNQRWHVLFTEFNQYVNTIATSYAFYDYAPDDIIAGDASRDFAWFIQRYLHVLRAQHAAVYDQFATNSCWRQLVLASWGKLNRYWVETRNEELDRLESDESPIVDELIRDPDLLAEIENLRVLDGCRD